MINEGKRRKKRRGSRLRELDSGFARDARVTKREEKRRGERGHIGEEASCRETTGRERGRFETTDEMTVLCALWATLSTVASILACSGFYLPYWIQVRERILLPFRSSRRRRTETADHGSTIDRSIDDGTLAFFLSSLSPSKFTRADRNRIRIRVLIRRRR